jgi:hypothetical protein
MNATTKLSLTFGLMLVLLWGCSGINPHPMSMTTAVQDAKIQADHDALASHYEQAANEMRDKVAEHKRLLRQYEANPWLSGKQATGFKGHCESLIQLYSRAAEENLQMAKLHRQVAEGVR